MPLLTEYRDVVFVQSVDAIFPYQNGCIKHSYTEEVVMLGQDLGVVRSNVVCLVRVSSDHQMTALPGAVSRRRSSQGRKGKRPTRPLPDRRPCLSQVSRLDGSVVTRVDTLGKITGALDENFEDLHDSDDRLQYDCSI